MYVRARTASTHALERRAGIRTEGRVAPDELEHENPHLMGYMPAGWFTLRRILKRGEVTPDDVFIDIGSGMGRLVFQAAERYPFRRVIGVEISEYLNAVARENIERNRHRLRCKEVEIVTADVLAYDLPDDVTVAYFYNPFTGPVFGAAVEKLTESLERRPRRLRVIYSNPREEERLLAAGFRRIRSLRGLRPGREWSRSNSTRMYEFTPS